MFIAIALSSIPPCNRANAHERSRRFMNFTQSKFSRMYVNSSITMSGSSNEAAYSTADRDAFSTMSVSAFW